MKVAVLSESPADEVAIRILIDGIIGRKTQPVDMPPIRVRGVSGVFNILPTVLKHLHYRTDADALVVVVDSDQTPVHRPEHEQADGADEKCRLCKMRQTIDSVLARLRPIQGRPQIKIAVGIAVPAVEAWYRCGLDPHVTEAAWIASLSSGPFPYTTRGLKEVVYGTSRPSLLMETQRAIEEARRLIQNLPLLEQCFPTGFGALAIAAREMVLESHS